MKTEITLWETLPRAYHSKWKESEGERHRIISFICKIQKKTVGYG